MTLLIACLLIYGFELTWWLYPVAIVAWILHMAYHDDTRYYKKLGRGINAMYQEIQTIKVTKNGIKSNNLRH